MAWTPPRTWVAGELVTASMNNTHIRDNFNLLKPYHDDEGQVKALLKGFAFSAGQSNGGGGGDTQLGSYDVTILSDYLSEPGDMLVVEALFSLAATVNTKTVKQIG